MKDEVLEFNEDLSLWPEEPSALNTDDDMSLCSDEELEEIHLDHLADEAIEEWKSFPNPDY